MSKAGVEDLTFFFLIVVHLSSTIPAAFCQTKSSSAQPSPKTLATRGEVGISTAEGTAREEHTTGAGAEGGDSTAKGRGVKDGTTEGASAILDESAIEATSSLVESATKETGGELDSPTGEDF